MRITLLLLFVLAFQLQAEQSYSQTTKISLDMKNSSIEKILQTIEEKSEFYFLYNSKLIDVDRKTDITALNESIASVLDQLFDAKEVEYEVKGAQIILHPKEMNQSDAKVIVASPQQQKKQISGTITDEQGEPIIGANVIEKGTTNGTVTDIDGSFSFKVEEDAILRISYIGYLDQEINTINRTSFEIVLQEDTQSLEEIVVVGYGTQKRINITGSVATINSEELTATPYASTTNALTGRLPGLITKQQSGLPGSDAADLRIRGFDNPLIIVDGIESNFNNIDANEIESISVLKDAAAAIYGSRAGNGVILVTTKRGVSGKPVIQLNSNFTAQSVTRLPRLASSGQMAELIREAHLNSGYPESTARFTEEEVDLFYRGTDPDYPNTDWYKIAARNSAPQHQHNLTIRGGNENIKYFGLFGYLDQYSIFKNNGGQYQRYNIRSNIDASITERLSLQVDLSSVVEDRDFPWRADERENSVWQEYWESEPFWLAELPDKSKIPYAGPGGAVGLHVITDSETSGYKRTRNQNLKGSLAAEYDFRTEGLSARAFVNYDQNYSFFKMWDWLVDSWSYNYSNDTYTQQTTESNRGLTYQNNKNRAITGQLSLNYDRIFSGDHHLSALALYEVIDYNNDWLNAFRDGQKTFLLDYAFAGSLANQRVNDGASEMGRSSLVGRLNYSFKSKYLFEGTLRIDKSAKFASEERTGFFPSLSAGWRISEESFIKNSAEALENLKLRLSYSQMGNDAVGNFQYLSGYRYGKAYLIGSNATAGLIETGLANPLLTWEKMTIYNTGIDFSINKNIIYGEIDFFYRNREGIPGTRTVSLPSTFGASLPVENLNSINTRGFELMLGHRGSMNDLKWNINANISWTRSKWGEFDEPEYTDPDEIRLYKRTGKWTNIDYGFVSDGVFTSQDEIDALDYDYHETQGNESIKPGDLRYLDLNGDGILNWRDQKEIGRGTLPNWMGGVNLDVEYQGFSVQALFQGAFGFTQKINLLPGKNYSEFVFNERWTPDNNHKNVLVYRLGGASSNLWNSDFNFKRSDYIRLKSLTFGYSLSKNIIRNIGLDQLRLFISGSNLFTLSSLNKYSIDPEGQSGYSGFYYPQMRTYTIGINASF